MPDALRGTAGPIGFSAETETVLYAVTREYFVDQYPLVTRLNREMAEGEVYSQVVYDIRSSTGVTLGANIADTSTTTVTVSDNSRFELGDVIEVGSERLEITAINTNGTGLTVVRGVEGTTKATATSGDAVTLLYNSATGDEVDRVASRSTRTTSERYVQTFQKAVQMGGKANAVRNIVRPAGMADLFTGEQMTKLTELYVEMERAIYYAKGQKPLYAGDRAKMKGLKTLISEYNSAANVTTSGATDYTLASFISDTIQKCYNAGGRPDLVIAAPNALTALATWGQQYQRITDRSPLLGLPTNTLVVPFLGVDTMFLTSQTLKAGTFIVCTSSDLNIKYIRNESWAPRGRRGDKFEGDWIADVTIDLQHPGWHAWREGVTTFKA